jgi:lipoprotein-releasing system ATP-binding protein
MIRLTGVGKKFSSNGRSVEVLRGVDLEIASGETVALCGPSGVGKSTLLHLLGLMEEASSGEIELFGIKTKILDNDSKAELRNRNIGFLFQFHYLAADFTVEENLLMPEWIKKGYAGQSMGSGLKDMVDRLGLAGLLGRYPNELSGGEQQRVALARALVNGPKLVLADEPTGNLDKKNAEVVAEMLLDESGKRNATLVVATHNQELAGKFKRIIYLQDGKIKSQ